ncbi:hypothetical protein LOZ48_004301 [Ophidiomyces ophidiicola]|nr:hypothetical protein LOZ48_004301 [Ophidiomyces ophidiicola]KAI2298662.1 hypothetical protein LOZ06_005426 [Ophidiomyces ophidiicola]
MSVSRRSTNPRGPKPNVTCMGLCMYGIGAGLLGVAATVSYPPSSGDEADFYHRSVTVGEKVESYFTSRPASLVPGRALETLLKLTPRPDSEIRSLTFVMNTAQGAVAGVVRAIMSFNGMRGPIAEFMFMGVRLMVDQVLEVWSGVGAWPWHWPVNEQAFELLHKAVYAITTGYIMDRWIE